jgi:hypothetical protein
MTFNTERTPETPGSKGFGSTKAVQKFWILRKRLETQVKKLAPQVGLEPTTLRLTAECSAIELLRSVGNGMKDRACAAISSRRFIIAFPPAV